MSLILKQISALGLGELIVRKSKPQIRPIESAPAVKSDRVTPEWNLWLPVKPRIKEPEQPEIQYMRNPEEQLFDEELAYREYEESQYPGPDRYSWDQFA